jgi:dolichol-phosphate mannosyltransferase
MPQSEINLDVTIVIPALREADNLELLLPVLHKTIAELGLRAEIVVVDEQCDERTRDVVARYLATILMPDSHGYGKALWAGMSYARSEHIITMDADLSHPPTFLADLWNAREKADIVIASRYVPGGQAVMPASRYWLSRILNLMFSLGLGLKVRDMSSGYRLYRRRSLQRLNPESVDFNILQEILVKAHIQGFTIKEVPFSYEPRRSGSSHARVFKFGLAYLNTFQSLWKLRNSLSREIKKS